MSKTPKKSMSDEGLMEDGTELMEDGMAAAMIPPPAKASEATTITKRKTSAEVWKEIRQEQKESQACSNHDVPWYAYRSAMDHPTCPRCADQDREHIREYRLLAQEHPNIYSWICLDPEDWQYRWPKDLILVFLGFAIQVLVPLAVSVQLGGTLPDGICPHAEEGKYLSWGKLTAFVLSFYFGVASVTSFLGKIRGNAFLLLFSDLEMNRKWVLMVGFAAQTLGLVAANVAEYLLFVSRGTDDFLLLLFTSTTFQATLNADTNNLVSVARAIQAEKIIARVLSDEALNLGDPGTPELPKALAHKLLRFRKIYDGMAALLFLFTVFLTASVTYCI